MFNFLQKLNVTLPSFRLKSVVFRLIPALASALSRPPEQFFIKNCSGQQRMSDAVAAGVAMLPILQAARLEVRPAVAEILEGGNKEAISLLSLCKRDPEILELSRERLRKLVEIPENIIVDWPDDLEKMLGPNQNKVALIHMDGNDLGKLFGSRLKNNEKVELVAGIRAMRELSQAIQEINNKSFSHASKYILDYVQQTDKSYIKDGLEENIKGKITMPLRPLVMGGDDITLIARADIVLPFVELFAQRFERLAAEKKLPLSIGIGMVIMNSSYPFAKAFSLVESLLENAKHLTLNDSPRPSSIDYLVLTEAVETNVKAVRARVYTAQDGSSLTARPMRLQKHSLANFLEDGRQILSSLSRSGLRPALSACRKGKDEAKTFWLNTRENLQRGLGGRKNKDLMSVQRFEQFFPCNNYFREDRQRGWYTELGDYLELAHILPPEGEPRNTLLNIMLEGSKENV